MSRNSSVPTSSIPCPTRRCERSPTTDTFVEQSIRASTMPNKCSPICKPPAWNSISSPRHSNEKASRRSSTPTFSCWTASPRRPPASARNSTRRPRCQSRREPRRPCSVPRRQLDAQGRGGADATAAAYARGRRRPLRGLHTIREFHPGSSPVGTSEHDLESGRRHRRQRPLRGIGGPARPEPPIAVITRSCHFDWQSPFFTEATAPPIVLTVADAVAGPGSRGAEVADIVTVGETEVDLRRALTALGDRGMRHALVEGGPGLNAQLAHAGLLDELCLTLSPRVVAGDGPRVLAGPELPEPLEPRVVQLLEEDGF